MVEEEVTLEEEDDVEEPVREADLEAELLEDADEDGELDDVDVADADKEEDKE